MNNFNFDLDNTIDEDFFGTLKNKSSKLQQLFGEDSISPDEKQQSLKYQRPKATDLKQSPKNDWLDTGSRPSQASLTVMAKVVVAYKQGELQGKVGLALIQNPDNTSVLIIYKTRTHILATMKLDPDQDLLFKQTKYWQFYDEESIYWSFSFDNQQDEDEFKENLRNKALSFKESIKETQENEREIEELLKQKEYDAEDFKSQFTKVSIKESKNLLINRMAKMGKPLPTLSFSTQQNTTEFSDSSDTEVINTPLSLAQKPTIAPRSSKLSAIKSYQQLVPSKLPYNSASAANAAAVFPINPMESQYMQMLLTEQRTQGSELRMNVNKLENKIEKVLDKLELFDRHAGKEKPHKDDEILELEEKVLMLKKENRKLKQSLEERSYRDSDDMKFKEILYEHKNDLKELNIEHTNDLKVVLKELIEKLKEFEIKNQEIQQNLKHTEAKRKDFKTQLDSEKLITIDNEKQIKLLKEQEQVLIKNQQEKEKLITEYKQQINELNKKIIEKTTKISENPAEPLVKSIMNNLYIDITEKLNNSNLPNSDKILPLIATSIRQQTMKSLQPSSTKED